MASYSVGDIKNLFTAGSDATKARTKTIRIAIFVEEGVAQGLIDIAKQYLNPSLPTGLIHVEVFTDAHQAQINTNTDIALIIGKSANACTKLYMRLAEFDIPTKIICDNADNILHTNLWSYDKINPNTILVLDPLNLSVSKELYNLGSWMLDVIGEDRQLALAANFTFARKALAESIVQETSKQNALVGGVTIIPGADMPVMTLNQAKMILQIAAAYGQEMGPERIKELAAVVGGGFALRALARNTIGIIPALGWAVKAGIGYSGTLAMGKAVIEYFEQGGNLQGMSTKLLKQGSKLKNKLQSKKNISQDSKEI